MFADGGHAHVEWSSTDASPAANRARIARRVDLLAVSFTDFEQVKVFDLSRLSSSDSEIANNDAGWDDCVETVEVILNNCDTRQKTIEGAQQP